MLKSFVCKHWKLCTLLALCAYVLGFWWWASSGFPAQEYVCDARAYSGDHNCAARKLIGVVHWVGRFHDELLVVGTFLLAFVVIFQIRDARKSSERQLRAYVVAGGVDCELKGRRFLTKVRILNTGQTPAYDVIVQTGSFPLVHPIDGPSALPRGVNDQEPSILTLGANQDTFSWAIVEPSDWTGDEEFIEAYTNGNLRIYFWGTVSYRDAFNAWHYTNFCSFYEWEGTVAGATTSTHHNDAS